MTGYQCRCDSRYEGCEHTVPCGNPGDGRWSPYFCQQCDARRMAHIGAQLRKLKEPL